jgi:hypothetical protein
MKRNALYLSQQQQTTKTLTMNTYFNFTRQEVLSQQDVSGILAIMNRSLITDFNLQNDIFGLFDGYYYFSILNSLKAANARKEISLDDTIELLEVLTKIQDARVAGIE